jgi:hypothetical protein
MSQHKNNRLLQRSKLLERTSCSKFKYNNLALLIDWRSVNAVDNPSNFILWPIVHCAGLDTVGKRKMGGLAERWMAKKADRWLSREMCC